jgi:hypothetical protein
MVEFPSEAESLEVSREALVQVPIQRLKNLESRVLRQQQQQNHYSKKAKHPCASFSLLLFVPSRAFSPHILGRSSPLSSLTYMPIIFTTSLKTHLEMSFSAF